MRRRRHRLEVSTFPFLAVLLCAMGSLILLLLVLDRRAKVVALAKAREARRLLREEQSSAAEAAKRAAEERQVARRLRLAERLQAQERERDELRDRVASVSRQAAEAAQRTARQRESAVALARRLLGEQQSLTQAEQEIAARRGELEKVRQQGTAAQGEAARMARQLQELEATLAALREARERDSRTFSVVPYKGRRGESRRPVYIECARNGLIFHPEKRLIREPGLFPEEVRREVDQHVSRQREGLIRVGAKPEAKPYLMMLVRPDGITTYYEAMKALSDREIEFGYEFVDADWLLNFPDSDDAKSPLPAMKTERMVAEPGASPTRRVAGLRPEAARGAEGESSATASGAGLPPLPPLVPPNRGAWGVERGASPSPQPLSPEGRGADRGLPPVSPDGRGARGEGDGRAALAPSPQPLSPEERGARAGNASSDGAERPPVPPAPPTGAGPGVSGTPHAPRPTPHADVDGSLPPLTPTPATSGPAKTGGPSPALPPLPGEQGGPGTPHAPRPTPHDQAPRPTPHAAPHAGEPSDTPGPEGAMPGLPPLPGEKRTAPPPPPRPVRFLGNRDWVIAVECLPDGVVLRSAGKKFTLADLTPHAGAEPAFVQAVRQMIARRQALVRPGEPPYRPQVRFLVHPESLRTYFVAYPALEPLGIPLTRQNVETSGEREP